MSYIKNQFFYTRKEPIEGTDPQEFTEYRDSINLNKVIRSVQMSPDNIVVLLSLIKDITIPKHILREFVCPFINY